MASLAGHEGLLRELTIRPGITLAEIKSALTERGIAAGHISTDSVIIGRRGDHVARRSLAFYQAIGDRLAGEIGGRS